MDAKITFTVENLPFLDEIETAPAMIAAREAKDAVLVPTLQNKLGAAIKSLKKLAAMPDANWKRESYLIANQVQSYTGKRPTSRQEAIALLLDLLNTTWNA